MINGKPIILKKNELEIVRLGATFYAKMAVTHFGSDNTVSGAVALIAGGLRRLVRLYGGGRLLDCRWPGRLADARIP